eukprot:2089006-Amphidinium_carterae.1
MSVPLSPERGMVGTLGHAWIVSQGLDRAGLASASGLKSPKYSVDMVPPEKLSLMRPLDDEGGVQAA